MLRIYYKNNVMHSRTATKCHTLTTQTLSCNNCQNIVIHYISKHWHAFSNTNVHKTTNKNVMCQLRQNFLHSFTMNKMARAEQGQNSMPPLG